MGTGSQQGAPVEGSPATPPLRPSAPAPPFPHPLGGGETEAQVHQPSSPAMGLGAGSARLALAGGGCPVRRSRSAGAGWELACGQGGGRADGSSCAASGRTGSRKGGQDGREAALTASRPATRLPPGHHTFLPACGHTRPEGHSGPLSAGALGCASSSPCTGHVQRRRHGAGRSSHRQRVHPSSLPPPLP